MERILSSKELLQRGEGGSLSKGGGCRVEKGGHSCWNLAMAMEVMLTCVNGPGT